MNNPQSTARASFRASFVALILGTAIGLSGCLAVATGAGVGAAVAYGMGELKANIPADLSKSTSATGNALTRMQFAKISEQNDALNTTIVSRTATDKKVQVKLSKLSDDTTNVKIRVGMFGDEATSLAVLEQIKSEL